MLREVVTDEEIATIVSRWTGIPVTRLQEGEREKVLRLGQILHERVVGQDEACRWSRTPSSGPGRHDRKRPDRSFIFLGPPESARRSWPVADRRPVRHRGN